MLHNGARSPEEVDLLSIRGLRKRPIICRLWDACQCAKTFLLGSGLQAASGQTATS